jgi:hypothetical protein
MLLALVQSPPSSSRRISLLTRARILIPQKAILLIRPSDPTSEKSAAGHDAGIANTPCTRSYLGNANTRFMDGVNSEYARMQDFVRRRLSPIEGHTPVPPRVARDLGAIGSTSGRASKAAKLCEPHIGTQTRSRCNAGWGRALKIARTRFAGRHVESRVVGSTTPERNAFFTWAGTAHMDLSGKPTTLTVCIETLVPITQTMTTKEYILIAYDENIKDSFFFMSKRKYG